MVGVGSAQPCKASLKAGDLQPHSSSTLSGSFCQPFPNQGQSGPSPVVLLPPLCPGSVQQVCSLPAPGLCVLLPLCSEPGTA